MTISIPKLKECTTSTELDLISFLSKIYPIPFSNLNLSRPFVTLTYAQSIDGKIAGIGNQQIMLSGKESMNLTHKLRELHDGILVGIGTVLSDNPQLNARYPTLQPLSSQPQPIILDSKLRSPSQAKLFQNFKSGINPLPIVVYDSNLSNSKVKDFEAGQYSKMVACPLDETGHLSLSRIVNSIAPGKSLMVEGGASIISNFLASGLVDLIIITIAPKFVGNGVGVFNGSVELPEVEHILSKNFGQDTIVVCKPIYKK